MSDFSVSSRAPSVGQRVDSAADSAADSAEPGTLGTGRGPDGQAVEWQPSVTKSQSLPPGAGLGVSPDKPITARVASAAPRVGSAALEDDGDVSGVDVSDTDSEDGIGTPPTTGSRTDGTQAGEARSRSPSSDSEISLLSSLSSLSSLSDESDDSDPGYRNPPPKIPTSDTTSVSSDDSLSLPPSPEEFFGAVSTDGADSADTLSDDVSDTTDYDENDGIRTDDRTLSTYRQVADDPDARPEDRELAAKLVKEIQRLRNNRRRRSV